MKHQITLEGEFTTLNQYVDAERSNRHAAAKIKKSETERVQWSAAAHPRLPTGRYDVLFIWKRINKRTDPDNIAFAQKFIFDGLQAAGYIGNDKWDWIGAITHLFEVDKEYPGVDVIFEAVE